ncbi:hypothetical protein [Nocardiopsis sp. L17-MgMaSL7]|uniref:hypothetical protein n=1 Tax=Nocardiopsis sp. L17-MgMaSL7 TaxID=1938893 RepID=UPI000D71B356|nr:hypothetical protein [Nocardiopsis sp. L17-MgMaSL7]PWV55057.1 hypothetical protein BDW27_10359 [Nocardiopsis sp. L17-MgMaSL7]
MGDALEAVIAPPSLLRAVGSDLSAVVSVTLSEGLVLVPVTEALASGDDPAAEAPSGFVRLTVPLVERVTAWSARGPVAYVEADSFGGTGSQRALVWDRGVVDLGPLHLPVGEPTPGEGTPIARALRRPGVVVGPDERDEFDAAGLGAHRSTEAWAQVATPHDA